jgi:hypothetical protein
MLPPSDYRNAPPTGWGGNMPQPGYGGPAEPSQGSYFPRLQDPQTLTQRQYGGYPGYPATMASRPEPSGKRRSLKWLWITLAVVAVLLVGGGAAGVWALGQIGAPGVTAGQFCANLSQQSYDTAYGQFSTSLRASLSQAQFHSNAAALDTAEGKVASCRASGNVNYTLGSSTAGVGLIVTRAKQGALTGSVHLKNESGAWKVDKLDTALLGINLGTVQAVEDYCTALKGQKYDAAYALLDSAQQSAQKQDAYTSDAKLRDQIDGTVSACALDAVATDNTDTAASVTLSITRAKLGQNSGKLALSRSGSQWKITSMDETIQGTNLQPLAAGKKFCSLLSQAKYTDAYNSTSSRFKQATSNATFMQLFNVSGVKWACGSANLSTYKVSGSNATYNVPLTAKEVASGTVLLNENIEMVLVLEGSTWKVQGFGDASQA